MRFNQKILMGTIILLALFLVGCSSDDDNGDNVTDGVTFEISGDVEGEKSGFATVVQTEEDGIKQLFFSMNDGISGAQTFSLIFYMSNTGQDVELPTQGEHSIGLPAVHDYYLDYRDISGNIGVDYGSIWGGASGTLTITESTSNRVSGRFEFTAEGNVDNTGVPTGSIEVTNGQFSAQVQ